MREIRKIEPKIPVLPRRKRVAAYARVSMDTERLQHSLSAQVSYYSRLIRNNPEWEYAGVYADFGISGTKTNRSEFQRLIADCEMGLIDIVLTKSISRFARNTVDLLNTVRRLKALGIEVRFEKENINSLSGDGEVMLTLLASFAQEESSSISNNEKWRIQKNMELGIPRGHFRITGYRWDKDRLVVIPEEAAVVQRIFRDLCGGHSPASIARSLNSEGITTISGKPWGESSIRFILTNVTYTGDLLMMKTFTQDPISKKRQKNNGELTQYILENSHEAIIDPEIFEQARNELARRSRQHGLSDKWSCFTGRIRCPFCGRNYIHQVRSLSENFWYCRGGRGPDEKCPIGGRIPDAKLRTACAKAMSLSEFDEDTFLNAVDRIEIPKRHLARIYMKDGRVVDEDCTPSGRRDCWTPQQRARVSTERRKRGNAQRGATCFTSKIRCEICGCNFQKQTSSSAGGEKLIYWGCARHGACGNIRLRDDRLRDMTAKVLGISAFDETVFRKQIDFISVSPRAALTFHFTDGAVRTRDWPLAGHSQSPAAVREAWTPERRQEASIRMKKIRRETHGTKQNRQDHSGNTG